MQGGRRPTRIAMLGTLAAILAIAAPALAQFDDFPRAPEPISARDLARYNDMLMLGEEQRYAVEGFHETYLDEFAPMRVEIMELAVEHPRPYFTGDDPFARRMPGFVARLRNLDAQFFESIEPLLTAEQRETLPRVRLLRERSLYANIRVVGQFIGHGIPDLSVILHDLKPPPQTMDEVRPMLLDYENRLTNGMGAIFNAAVRLCGAADDDAAAEALIERVRSLRTFNRRSYEQIAAHLSGPVARQFEREFFGRAYGSAYSSPQSFMLPRIDAAIERDELTDDEQSALRPLLRERRNHLEQALRELIEMADEDFIYRSPPGGAVPRRDDRHERINAARREAGQRDLELRRALRELLGEERATEILTPLDDGGRMVQATGGLRAACGVTSTAPRIRETRRSPAGARLPGYRSDPLLAHPIELADLDDYALLLDLHGERRRVLMDVYQPNAERLEEQTEPLQREWMTINFGRMNESQEERAERMARMPEFRTRFRNVIAQADARFFDDLSEALELEPDDERLDRARRLRQRAFYGIATIPQPDNPNRAGEADIVLTLVRARLDDEEWAAIEDIVDEYELRAYALLRERHEATSAADVRAGRGGVITQEERQERTRRSERPHERHRALVALVQETIDAIADALPWESAWRVLDAFNRQAYPLAFEDPLSMEQALGQAASLHDLTTDQRDRIGAIRAESTTAYEEVRSAIIEASAEIVPDLRIAWISMTIPEEKARAQERFSQMYTKLTEERAAINRRALRGLRTALTPAQLRRLDLPQVE